MQYAHYPSLKQKHVVITGGATGIGASLVQAFSCQEASVSFLDINQKAGEALAESLDQSFYHVDLSQIAALQTCIKQLQKARGPVDILINNAASDQRRHSLEIDEAFWDQMMAVNLKQVFFASQAVLPDMMQKNQGVIINLSSNCFLLAQNDDYPAYMTAKSALVGLTRALATEFGQYNIRVNALLPGWVMTEKQISLWLTDAAEQELLKSQALKQKLMPEDIAAYALFLASDQARLASKQSFIVDGGRV